MSVNETFALPAQPPAGGSVTYAPLGGNGYTSPHACYLLNQLNVTGDASGGFAEMNVDLDDRYQNLVSVAACEVTAAAAAVACRLTVGVGAGSSIIGLTVESPGTTPAVDTVSRATWSPPPLFNAFHLKARWPNANGSTFLLSGVVYLFDKRASETTPLSVLLQSLPRGQVLIP